MGCGLFKGVFRLHIELARHLVAIIRTEIIIQRFAVAAYAAAYTCCVGGEYGRYRREHILYIQQTHGRRPFVEVGHNVLVAYPDKVADAFNHNPGCVGEGTRLVVVAISVQGIYAIEVPHTSVERVFLLV